MLGVHAFPLHFTERTSIMKVESLTYGYKRQPKPFESEHLEVTIEAEEGDKADEILEKARTFVLSRLFRVDDTDSSEADDLDDTAPEQDDEARDDLSVMIDYLEGSPEEDVQDGSAQGTLELERDSYKKQAEELDAIARRQDIKIKKQFDQIEAQTRTIEEGNEDI